MEQSPSLVAADYVIIACMLSVSLGVGIFLAIQRRKVNTKEDYLLGNRKLHVLPVTLSMFVTFMSSISLIGVPAEAYTSGFDVALFSVAWALSYLAGIFTVIPIMHPLKVTSLYEYYQLRYQSSGLRLLVTCVGMCQKILYTAIVLLSPALSVQTATGLPLWVSVVIVGAVGIIYTSIGGIRGVVLVDVFQAIIIMIGILSVLIKAILDIGGLDIAWSIAKDGNRIKSLDFDPDPRVRHSFWALAVGGMFTFFAMTFDQSAVQRVCSIPTVTGARIITCAQCTLLLYGHFVEWALVKRYWAKSSAQHNNLREPVVFMEGQIIRHDRQLKVLDQWQMLECRQPMIKCVYAVNILLAGVYLLSLSLTGIVAYSYFVTVGCDPFKSGIITNKNQLMPFIVMKIFKEFPGMTGLYLATIFSGALSTVSSIINGLAANTIEDILVYPLNKFNVTESIKLLIVKLSVCFYGGLCIGLAFLASNIAGTVIQTTIALLGALGGPIVGIFFLGALFPWANKIGAVVGLLVSLVFSTWLAIGAVLYGHKPVKLPAVPGNSCVVYNISNDTFSTALTLSTIITTSPSGDNVPDRTLYDISYQYYGLTGWLLSFIVGLLVSLITYKWCQPVSEERLFFPFVRKLWNLKSSYTVANNSDEKKDDLDMDDIGTHNVDVHKTV